MNKWGRLALAVGFLAVVPVNEALADTYAVVFNQSGGLITVSNSQYHMAPESNTATWTWLDFTVNSGDRSWHVVDSGIRCGTGGTGWVIRATSGSSGAYEDTCMQIPWGQVGCVGVAITSSGLKMAQIPTLSCSNSWWEQAGSPVFMQVLDIVLKVAEALA